MRACLAIGALLFLMSVTKANVPVARLLHATTTWQALGIICLFGVTWLPYQWWTSLEVAGSLSPPQTLYLTQRGDLVVTISDRLLTAAVLWLWCGTLIVVAYGVYALIATVLTGPLLGGGASAAGSYGDARTWLSLTHRLPWRIMPFLADAHRRGVLRQVGAVYQFRHIRLQEHLAAKHPIRHGLLAWWPR